MIVDDVVILPVFKKLCKVLDQVILSIAATSFSDIIDI